MMVYSQTKFGTKKDEKFRSSDRNSRTKLVLYESCDLHSQDGIPIVSITLCIMMMYHHAMFN